MHNVWKDGRSEVLAELHGRISVTEFAISLCERPSDLPAFLSPGEK